MHLEDVFGMTHEYAASEARFKALSLSIFQVQHWLVWEKHKNVCQPKAAKVMVLIRISFDSVTY